MNRTDQNSTPVRFLEGPSVYLRQVEPEEAELYQQTLFDPEVRRLTGTQRTFTQGQIRTYLEAKGEDSSSLLLWIALKDSDKPIGDIALQDIDRNNRSANIRIAIGGSEHKGKGYGSEALCLLLDYGFGILNLHRIELNVYSFNSHAQHVYEKLGFVREGVQRDALFYDHEYHDSILMSILEDDYRRLYNNKSTE
ncbi:GNAT family N-acetyltransferase [Paenibacillus segetis]|uniref:N-acetyltransferase n=1 Tax=Paenibacillus segetis TaxID=1325360 RepID=A0ABQ1YPA8_9BACL|nr:GNAT family protein [Paenibacillus segetis]GGH32039.1 N-acetyltransferase [Paenibacillus segetis]